MLAERLIRKEDWSRYVHTEDRDLEGIKFGIPSEKKNRMPDPLIQATRMGNSEVALEILRVYPEAAYTFDEKGRNILQIAVEEKKRFLYDYLMTSGIDKDRMLSDTDHEGNSIIHLAASLGSPPSTPPGRVQYDSYPYLWQLQKSEGKTTAQVFETNHASVHEKAEKTMKEMANSVLIVFVLIGTINFAAVFTVPGGFNQDSGDPVYLKNRHSNSACCCSTLLEGCSPLFTMGTLLAIIFLRFATEGFYAALSFKYVVTTIAMFYSRGLHNRSMLPSIYSGECCALAFLCFDGPCVPGYIISDVGLHVLCDSLFTFL
ncbi:uncharacterized protein LOC113780058 [Coffea eugenioides]|uniref:uncharacterized protein LOC113780058 n=1 Tax=Coffea eugenioides TaxID=49369 RepID=UPI000F60A733|nr:uncharacterized protein LOC113780058 [Coffea eugenioides]